MDAIASATAGMTAATNRFAASAARTAGGAADLASEAVEQVSSKQAFSASLAVIKASDDMLKQLLDIKV